MTKETMKKLKRGDTVYVACKVDAVFINGGFIQVSTRDCNEGFDAYEDEVLEPSEDCVSRAELKKWLDMNFSFGGALRKLEMFDRLDKELLSVTPALQTGHWIRAKDKTGHLVWECDNCGWQQRFATTCCPDCGQRNQKVR